MFRLLLFAIFVVAFASCFNAPSEKKSDPRIAKIDSLKNAGFDIIDLHAHLKGGLTIQDVLEHSEKSGIRYGIAANCGVGFPIQNDSALSAYYHSLKNHPVYIAMQAEGREWTRTFSSDSIALFDYVFTDAMTFTDPEGHRTRLWMKDEVHITDPNKFMEFYVNKITEILNKEPINIYVNPTFLPEVIRDQYDELWTDERIQKVVAALKNNHIACEINARYKIPSAHFIKVAKSAGVKFTLGTNNSGADLGYLEYSLKMIDECGLKPDDFWKPAG